MCSAPTYKNDTDIISQYQYFFSKIIDQIVRFRYNLLWNIGGFTCFSGTVVMIEYRHKSMDRY